MIKKIIKIKNVGLFNDVTCNGTVNFKKITKIYADNGRGKSTLSMILRASTRNISNSIIEKTTLGSQNLPEIEILLENNTLLTYNGGVWNGSSPLMDIYDSTFIEDNIYTGFEVRPDHRQSLLDFIIGEQSVQLKKQLDEIIIKIQKKNELLSVIKKQIRPYQLSYSLPDFLKLKIYPEAQNEIINYNRQLVAISQREIFSKRQLPKKVPQIEYCFDEIIRILNIDIGDIDLEAMESVKTHICQINNNNFETWINEGQKYLQVNNCPFCGQLLIEGNMIKHYRFYFNESYSKLKIDIEKERQNIKNKLSNEIYEKIVDLNSNNSIIIQSWKEQMDIDSLSFPINEFQSSFKKIRELLSDLLGQKVSSPLEGIYQETSFSPIKVLFLKCNQIIDDYNNNISSICEVIIKWKERLNEVEISQIKKEIEKLQISVNKKLPEVAKLIDEYQLIISEYKILNDDKAFLRQQIDQNMISLLTPYLKNINENLLKLGTDFTIEELNTTYTGGIPRINYGLFSRNVSIPLNPQCDPSNSCSFKSFLSEADKRNLAFAFFITKLELDPFINNKIIVFDDPVSSLDSNRKHQSIQKILYLSKLCKQTIILSHDGCFLHDLEEQMRKIHPITDITLLKLSRVFNNNSVLELCESKEFCSSQYYRHHSLISDFVDGKNKHDIRDVAKAIRPLLEAYYHHRFPKTISSKEMLGQIIIDIQNARLPNPLTHCQQDIRELREITDFANQFHHDTNAYNEMVNISESQVLPYAQRALNLIYKNG